MTAIIQSIISVIGIYYVVKLVRTTGKHAQVTQPNEAHRLLMEVEVTDKVMNILPLELRDEIRAYMKQTSPERTHNA